MWLTQDSLMMYYKIFKLDANPKNNCKSQYATTIQSKKKKTKNVWESSRQVLFPDGVSLPNVYFLMKTSIYSQSYSLKRISVILNFHWEAAVVLSISPPWWGKSRIVEHVPAQWLTKTLGVSAGPLPNTSKCKCYWPITIASPKSPRKHLVWKCCQDEDAKSPHFGISILT